MNTIKVVIFGSASVGKSSILSQFASNHFSEDFVPNLNQRYSRTFSVDSIPFNFELTDTSGQETDASLIQKYIDMNDAFILNFSVTNQESLNRLEDFYNQIYLKEKTELPMVLAGNKVDHHKKRAVSYHDAKIASQEWECEYFETSAKKNEKILDIFEYIARRIIILRNLAQFTPSKKKYHFKMPKLFRKKKIEASLVLNRRKKSKSFLNKQSQRTFKVEFL
jgi:small GTP-binding protein